MWINVVPPDGVPRRVAGYTGESLLDVIMRNKVPGIFRKHTLSEIHINNLADCKGGDNELKPY